MVRFPLVKRSEVCRQIAEGLEAAHNAGIVHRDSSRPMSRFDPTGGSSFSTLASPRPSTHPTAAGELTRAASDATVDGMVLGTPAYMSPEQAPSKPVEAHRKDIWAFGCCLYECLSGRSPFKGETITDTLAAVLDKDPDWAALGHDVPAMRRGSFDVASHETCDDAFSTSAMPDWSSKIRKRTRATTGAIARLCGHRQRWRSPESLSRPPRAWPSGLGRDEPRARAEAPLRECR